MPQLDQVTFLSQLWWCFFFFLGFYFVIHKYFLPKISRILKLRRKKITMSQDDLSFAQKEINKLRVSKETLFRRGLDLSQSIFTESSKLIHKSRDTKNVIHLLTEKYKNKPFFSDSETFYVEFLGKSFVSQKYILQLYSPKFNNKLSLFEIYSFFQKKALHTFKSSISHNRNRSHFAAQHSGDQSHISTKSEIGSAENIKKNVSRVEQTDKKKGKQKKKK